MAVLQLFILPPIMKVVGIGTWQRLGCVVGVLAFLAVPAVKALSWNYPSLFAASVTVNTFALCGAAAVSGVKILARDYFADYRHLFLGILASLPVWPLVNNPPPR